MLNCCNSVYQLHLSVVSIKAPSGHEETFMDAPRMYSKDNLLLGGPGLRGYDQEQWNSGTVIPFPTHSLNNIYLYFL